MFVILFISFEYTCYGFVSIYPEQILNTDRKRAQSAPMEGVHDHMHTLSNMASKIIYTSSGNLDYTHNATMSKQIPEITEMSNIHVRLMPIDTNNNVHRHDREIVNDESIL